MGKMKDKFIEFSKEDEGILLDLSRDPISRFFEGKIEELNLEIVSLRLKNDHRVRMAYLKATVATLLIVGISLHILGGLA